MKLKLSALGLVLFLIALPAAAARKDKPTGDEIAAKAKAGKLQNENTTVGENCKLTPADLTHLGSMTDLEDGQFIGVLETDIASTPMNCPSSRSVMDPRWVKSAGVSLQFSPTVVFSF